MEASVALNRAVAPDGDLRTPRVLVVWGVCFARESIVQLLESEPTVAVIGHFASLPEALASGSASRADIVLLDARLSDGVAAVRRAHEAAPGIRIVVCAVAETEHDIIAWAEAGVIGYIPRTATRADFVRRILDIHSGEQSCSGRVATSLLRQIARAAQRRPDRDASPSVSSLTRRERQTADLIRSGYSDKEIARELNISLATTKSHVHNLLGKLNIRRRSQVATSLRLYD